MPGARKSPAEPAGADVDVRQTEALLETGALQSAIKDANVCGFDVVEALGRDPTTARIPIPIPARDSTATAFPPKPDAPRQACTPVASVMTTFPSEAVDRPARVLIVDDDRHNRDLLEAMLSQDGYLLQTAGSGEEALDMVTAQRPDLILLDVMMPGMDGFQVARTIKGNQKTRNVPIIMITALGDRDARLLGLKAGAEDFLTKPVDRTELSVRVRNLLRLKVYGDYHDQYSQRLEGEIGLRAADLVESERLYRLTFDAAPVGIAHVGLDGQWLRVNQRLCDLLGYGCEELQGAPVQELLQPEDVAGEAESFRQMAAGMLDRHVIEAKRLRRRDGSFVWVRINMSVHRDTEGQARHFISVIEDITERRTLERLRNDAENELRAAKEAAESGQPGQERVPGEHEPRDPDADERHHRHDRARPGHRPHARAARVSADRQVVRPTRC